MTGTDTITPVSNGSPPRRPRKGGSLVIVLATLLPACFAGWLVWQSARGDTDAQEPARALPAPPVIGSATTVPTAAPTVTAPAGGPSSGPGEAGDLLKGRVVVLDPGHNPGNRDHTEEISRSVDIGTGSKECDTTGTATDAGYPEAEFTLDVSRRARAILQERGATVVLTQNADRPFGPCVDERARLGNEADADAVVSVHADGAPAGDRGFHVILPAKVRQDAADTTAITGSSRRLGKELSTAFRRATGSSPANYVSDGGGLTVRNDLGGLNLSRVPKVFIECGNMRDPQEARDLTDPRWRGRAARGIADGITNFLRGSPEAKP